MDISVEKKQAAFGLIAAIVGNVIPFIGFIISIGGFVAYIISIMSFSKKFNNNNISKNFFYSILSWVVGFVIFLIFAGSAFLPLLSGAKNAPTFSGGIFILAILVFWIFFVLSGFFTKKYFDIFYEYTKEDLFRYAGLGVFIGSFIFLNVIGLIISIFAFLKIPDNLDTSTKINTLN